MSDLLAQLAQLSPEKRELLALLLQEEGVDLSRSVILPQPRNTNTFPLSFAQQRLWFLDQLEPGSAAYNIPTAVRLTGALNPAALEYCLSEIVRRHEILRTTFSSIDEQPVQVIAPALSLSLPLIDLHHLPEADRTSEAERLALAEAQRPFNLVEGPLLRATLLRLGETDHIILLTMHHIISDGWSMGVLVREIAALYEVYLTGGAAPLPELSIQYADFAHWQRQWLQGETLDRQLAYWKQQLNGDLPVLALPADRPRVPLQTHHGATFSFKLPPKLSAALNALSRQEEATLFMTLLAAFQTLLYRYTGQEDICVGTPIANRNRAEIEDLIGFFVNTLVLRASLAGKPTFRQLLSRVREVTLGAYAHQDLPFELLVEKLQPERDLSRTPLFQTMFVLQNAPVQTLNLPGVTLSQLETDLGAATFDLTLMMHEEAAGLSGAVEYSADLFDAATIERLVGHFQTLLAAIVADPDQPLACLPLLTQAEQYQLLVDWNATAAPYPQEQCLPHLFEAQAERTPNATAAVFEEQRLTYAELNRRANQLAHYLQKLGVGPETVVGIWAERSLEMVISLLSILKAGGAYLPLDPTQPPERLAFMLEDTQAPVILTPGKLGVKLDPLAPGHKPISVDLSAAGDAIAQESPANLAVALKADNLAYIIYTSGSTGQPKGVLISHRAVINHNVAIARQFQLEPSDRVLQFATLTFDAAVEEIFPTWLTGATLVLRPPYPLAAADLTHLIEKEHITILDLPTAYWHEWTYELSLAHISLPSSLRLVIVGGERAAPERLALWQKIARPPIRWLNTYGPTEATVVATVFEVTSAHGEWNANTEIPIGYPLANVQAYVLDQHLQPVPIGVPGELYLGGAGLARGYLNRPNLTAERFIPNPFGRMKDEGGRMKDDVLSFILHPSSFRLYKTGDLVRYRSDGALEYLGRVDQQVKVRGFRVELGEIEAVLGQHPALRQAAVLAWDNGHQVGDKQLVAYVLPAQVGVPPASELRRYLQEKLPEYMIPSVFIPLETLPLTSSHKLDRRALPPPGPTRRELETVYVAPHTPMEEMLAGLWQEVLGLPQVGIHDNFFELGGHSLLATQLISRLRHTFQAELPLRALFEQPTIAGLARQLETASTPPAPPIQPISRETDPPLSFAQQRLWFLDQLEPGSPLYNISDVIRLSGPLNVTALEQSLNEIVCRHEILRTTFPTVDGRARQVIAPALTIPLRIIDLRRQPPDRREAEAHRLAAGETQSPFNLEQGPLLRVALLQLAPTEFIIVLVMHHIIADGWSTGLLIRELAALYPAFVQGQSSPLPALPLQYADFASWQRRWLQGEVLESQLAYWKQQLAGCPPLLELPTDRPRPAVQSFHGAISSFSLPPDLSIALHRLSRQEGVTLFMTLLAAFQTLLYRYSGQEDICVGTPIANRNRAEIEELIGFFVNTLVLRANLAGQLTFRELLQQVRAMTLGAYAHQDLPFEMLVDELQTARNLSHSPLFQVMFAFQNISPQALVLPELTLTPLPLNNETAKFDLTLVMTEEEDGLSGTLEYNTDLFDAATMERMVGHFQRLLAAIIVDPNRPISRLPLLDEAEQAQLLVEWNDTQADYPQHECAHQLFEAQVGRTPEAIALVCEEQALTYRELNRRANQLAHYLQKLGIGPETRVALLLERSADRVVAEVGVLKAGGAYVPLDPTYPPERLAFMLADSQASVLLTQQTIYDLRFTIYDLRFTVHDPLPHPSTPPPFHPSTLPPLHPSNHPTLQPSIVYLDSDGPDIARERAENPASGATAGNLAYIIYTSGSTGTPKGVQVEHRALLNLIFWHQHTFAVSAADRATQLAGLGFDASIWETWPYLTAGASLHLPREETRLSPLHLRDWLVAKGITISFLPTPLAESVMALEWPGHTALRCLLTGGDKLHHFPSPPLPFVVINNYGPTEDTVVATSGLVPCSDQAGISPPIGYPIANTQAYLLDAHLQPVPIGVPGELYLGGLGLARGYLNRPDLTAERFIPNPFLKDREAGGRMKDETLPFILHPSSFILYRTGDLARYRPDGQIEFLGRIDHQVKLRGFRIELGEIEAVLKQHPAVEDAIALLREDTPGDKRLVAYLLPKTGGEPGVGELRDFLKQKLPDYMLPAAFVMLDTLPLTPNGKINRRALPAPAPTRPDLESRYEPPHSLPEQTLAHIWSQVLGLEQVGIYDNFFELGGDSILSIQVIARAHQAGLHLTPKDLFQNPTIAGLAAVAGAARPIQAEQGVVTGSVPLTPIQRWFFEQHFPQPHHWNQAVLLEVRQPLQPELLKQAVHHLLVQHDALRLRFYPDVEGAAWQQLNAGLGAEVEVAWFDLSALPPGEQQHRIEAQAAEVQASLNLSAGPLIRLAYFELGAGRPARLLIVIHHLAIDGVSWRILVEDLQMVYQALQLGQPVQLPPKTTSFQDWAYRLNDYAHSPAVKQEVFYWLGLGAESAPSLPVDFPGGANTEATARGVTVSLNEADTQALLQQVSAVYGTEITEVLLTALVQAVTAWTGQNSLLIELEGHGREDLFDDVDLSRTIGWFTTIYPVRLQLPPAAHPGQALMAVKEQVRRVPGRGLGYGLLRYLAAEEPLRRQLAALPQPQLSFNYLGQFDQLLAHDSPIRLASEPSGPARSLQGHRNHLLEISGGVTAGRLQLEWTYSENLYRPTTIEQLAQHFTEALQSLIAHCQAPEAGGYTPSDFPLAGLNQKKLDKILAKMK